VRDQITKEKI